jgi:hypothetical protein
MCGTSVTSTGWVSAPPARGLGWRVLHSPEHSLMWRMYVYVWIFCCGLGPAGRMAVAF